MNQDNYLSCFKDYITLKLHFNSSEFIWREGVGSKIGPDAMYKRKDFTFFAKLTKQIPCEKERRQYLISCFLFKPDSWIGEIFETEIKDFHRKRMMRLSVLQSLFISEVENIIDFMTERKITLRELLVTTNSAPVIITERSNIIGGVSNETLGLIDKGFNFTSHKSDDPLWQKDAFVLSKYRHFLKIDEKCMVSHFNKLASLEVKEPTRAQYEEKIICHSLI